LPLRGNAQGIDDFWGELDLAGLAERAERIRAAARETRAESRAIREESRMNHLYYDHAFAAVRRGRQRRHVDRRG
jgi:hypothetical protein